MEKVTITSATLSALVASSTVATVIHVISGNGALCLGSTSGVTLDECIPIGPGYQMTLPATLNASAARIGGENLVIVKGPAGV
jgi:hypothetical protein